MQEGQKPKHRICGEIVSEWVMKTASGPRARYIYKLSA